MNTRRSVHTQGRRQVWPIRGRRWWFAQAFTLAAAIGIGAIGGVALQNADLAARLFAETPADSIDYAARAFPVCAGSSRHTCVVDGDTFWLEGVKVRMADINTPEMNSPQCAAEATLGRQATLRLVELLNAGSFSLVGIDRDEDQYGRKLRLVMRDGVSLGDVLIAEGLAHAWRGRRESWC